jgi:asparagine synthase (glutamine-hydrolysing)
LTVIDLVSGEQPLRSADGNIVLVCNGEIYDFERLRDSLVSKGHRFQSKSDSEVIIGLYQEYGLGCFEHLRGEFAFLLYDRARRLVVAGRDRFGIKPLYFSRLSGGVVFASEMKALFASGLVAPKMSAEGLDPLLSLDPEHVRFPFEGVEHVPPASFMCVDLESLETKITPYWSNEIPAATAEPVLEQAPLSTDESAQIVLKELEDAVRLRLRADVPVGLYLSGGIDSAFVGALMDRHREDAFHSFSISFGGSDRNEQRFTRQAAAFLDTRHHELTLTRQELWDNLEDTIWSAELPFASLAPVGKFLLSKLARQHVTVVLNGQGADEVFLGYRSFFQRAIDETRNPHARKLGNNVRARRLKLAHLPASLLDKLSLLLFRKEQRLRVLAARASAAKQPEQTKPIINFVQERRIAEMPIDILGYLGDRVEMAHSLEVRVPFLDHHLYDAAKRIPVDLKLCNGIEKAVLREAAKGILPEDIRTRRKLGFMLTSDRIDFFGADRALTAHLRGFLTKQAFDDAQVYAWSAYRLLRVLARLPLSKRIRVLKRLRANANKIIMYMLQTHMLHAMYVVERRWEQRTPIRNVKPARPPREREIA